MFGAVANRWKRLQIRVLNAVLIKFIARAEGPLTHEVENFDLGQDLTIFPSAQHLQHVEHPLYRVVRDLKRFNALPVQVPCG